MPTSRLIHPTQFILHSPKGFGTSLLLLHYILFPRARRKCVIWLQPTFFGLRLGCVLLCTIHELFYPFAHLTSCAPPPPHHLSSSGYYYYPTCSAKLSSHYPSLYRSKINRAFYPFCRCLFTTREITSM